MARMEGHDAARRDGDLLAGLGIATGALRLVTELKVAETRQLHAFAALQRKTDLVEETVDHILGLALVQSEPLEQGIRQFRLGDGARQPCISGGRTRTDTGDRTRDRTGNTWTPRKLETRHVLVAFH